MITENKTISAASLAALAQLAEEESRNKSNRMIYYMVDSRYTEMMKFNEELESNELGHGFKLDDRKRGIE